jgi:integrase/recombinase XerD
VGRVNILKQVKVDGRWKLVSIPRDGKGGYDWKALPEGRYFIEWWQAGKRKREAGGGTAAEALEAARLRKHILEGRALGIKGYAAADEEAKRAPLHVAVGRYLDVVENLKKPNTLRKYRAVLKRFLDYFATRSTIDSITTDDLNQFMVHLKKRHRLENNSLIHNMVIVAQFMKKQGRPGLMRGVELPEPVRSLPREYTDGELEAFFAACSSEERALFATFLLTGFREMEVVHLAWTDINFTLSTIRVTAKPDLGFSPKRWEEREVPAATYLMELLKAHPHKGASRLVFPSPPGNREYHMLDKCKAIAERAKLNPEHFDLRKFRSTYATRMLRAGFDVRTVQHWLGHRSLETTMRYLAPARDVRERLDQVQIAGVLTPGAKPG